MIKIDKGIPAPKVTGTKHGKFPWHEMEIGDSFAIPAIGRAPQHDKVRGMKFTCRKQVENGAEVYRVWRIK